MRHCECCHDLKTRKRYSGGTLETEAKMLERRVCEKPECIEWMRANKKPMVMGFVEPPRPSHEVHIDSFLARPV